MTWNAGELYIEFAPESRYLFNTLSDPKNRQFLADACREVTGQETSIRVEIKEPRVENDAAAKDDEKQRLREMAESSPVVQQALKTFRGEIVDVRRSKTNRGEPN